jgi:hypothetical protein
MVLRLFMALKKTESYLVSGKLLCQASQQFRAKAAVDTG